MQKIGEKFVARVVKLVRKGLVRGLGRRDPAQMCVQAAVNYAMGAVHGDYPICVNRELRDMGVWLNDKDWSSDMARGLGLQRLAITQLGTHQDFDIKVFKRRLTVKVNEKWADTIGRTFHSPLDGPWGWEIQRYLEDRLSGDALFTEIANLIADTLQDMQTQGSAYTCLLDLPDDKLPVVDESLYGHSMYD